MVQRIILILSLCLITQTSLSAECTLYCVRIVEESISNGFVFRTFNVVTNYKTFTERESDAEHSFAKIKSDCWNQGYTHILRSFQTKKITVNRLSNVGLDNVLDTYEVATLQNSCR